MFRRIAATALAVGAFAPGVAFGAVQVESIGENVIVDGDADANTIVVSAEAEHLVITPGTDANPNDDCEQDGTRVRCDTLQGLDTVLVRAGEGNDTLTADTSMVFVSLNGQGGDDTLNSSGSGSDTEMSGGDGGDTLNARTGYLGSSDSGDAGNDVFNGNPEDLDFFSQEPGADRYVGGTPAFSSPICGIDPEYCVDGDEIDYVTGPVTVTLDGNADDGAGEGDNVSADIEIVSGTAANDTLNATGATQQRELNGSGGDDTLIGGAGDDRLSAGTGADVAAGGPGDDVISSGAGESDAPAADRMDGGEGDDVFGGGFGPDDVNGGPGMDAMGFERFDAQGLPIGFEITLDDQPNDGARGAGEADNIRSDVEIISTGAGADRIIGSSAAQQLSGGFGNDEIDGGAGVDVIDGGNGADSLTSRDLGFDIVNCGDGVDPSVQGDEGDRLDNCEASALTPLPPPPDTIGPQLTLAGATSISARSFSRVRGVMITARTNEATVLFGEALAKGMVARAGDLVLGQKTLPHSNASLRKVKITFSRSYVRAIKRRLKKRSYRVTVRITATDAAGNRTVASKRVTIRKAPRRR